MNNDTKEVLKAFACIFFVLSILFGACNFKKKEPYYGCRPTVILEVVSPGHYIGCFVAVVGYEITKQRNWYK